MSELSTLDVLRGLLESCGSDCGCDYEPYDDGAQTIKRWCCELDGRAPGVLPVLVEIAEAARDLATRIEEGDWNRLRSALARLEREETQ